MKTRKPIRKLFSLLLTVAMVFSLLLTITLPAFAAGTASNPVVINFSTINPDSGGSVNYGDGYYYYTMAGILLVIITDDGYYTLTGVMQNAVCYVDDCNINLDNVTVASSPQDAFGYLNITGANVNLTLTGTNRLIGSGSAAIRVTPGSTVTIDGTGSLTATGGDNSAGIGGGVQGSDCGVVIINGGTINAYAGIGNGSAGIGGAYSGNGGSITINGGTVNAYGGNGRSGVGGAGIGGGGNGGSGGTVKITNGTVNATGGNNSAGIGGGTSASGGDITISGGDVIANGGENGAGIGGGSGGAGGDITIAGGNITANGGNNGAGIGGGNNGNSGYITVNGGTVNAKGGRNGAGIGGGYNGSGDTIIINNGTVNSVSGVEAKGIGGGAGGSDGTVTFNGGSIANRLTIGLPNINVNTANASTIGFYGHEWRVIGYNGSGVVSSPGTLTLFMKGVYARSPFGNDDNAYSTSVLINSMNSFRDSGGTNSREINMYLTRNIEGGEVNYGTAGFDGDRVKGASVTSQTLWPLSYNEAMAVNTSLLKFDTSKTNGAGEYWLRSPWRTDDYAMTISYSAYNFPTGMPVDYPFGLYSRFATIIKVPQQDVLYASIANGEGAKPSSVGLFTPFQTPSDNDPIKMTMYVPAGASYPQIITFTDNIVPMTVKRNETITLNYIYATAGGTFTWNSYITCILVQNGVIKYYAKLLHNDVYEKANGTVDIPIYGVDPGVYTLCIFSEQDNGENFTDFCSQPIAFPLTVENEFTDDTTPPVLTAGSAERINITDAEVEFTSSEFGWLYHAFVEEGGAKPTINTSGEGDLCTPGENTTIITGFETRGAKDVYIVVKDISGNVSESIKVAVPKYEGIDDRPVINQIIAFGGKLWTVIGEKGRGIAGNGDENSKALTLFLAGGLEYGTVQFSSNSSNEYSGSNLQSVLEAAADEIIDFEKELIIPRDLPGGSGTEYEFDSNRIAGQDVTGARLWPLSEREVNMMARQVWFYYSYPSYWLRSPRYDNNTNATVMANTASNPAAYSNNVDNDSAVRPAFILDTESVYFSSAVSGGKSNAVTGTGFAALEQETDLSASDPIKYTVVNPSLLLTVDLPPTDTVKTSEALTYSYSGASTGVNMYISCVLEQDGKVIYYAKLADCSEAAAASGSVSIPFRGITAGDYTLKIFSEQANGSNYTDFCCEPTSVPINVEYGSLFFTTAPGFDIPEYAVGDVIEEIDVTSGLLGGTPPYKFSAAGLPSGIVISESGVISGTPNAERPAGTAVITVKDSASPVSETASITINYGVITANAQTPVITGQPQNVEYRLNAMASALTITASITDGGVLSYQWYRNTENSTSGGVPVGGNSASHTPSTAETGTFYYYVEVTNTNINASGYKTATEVSVAAIVTIVKKEGALDEVYFGKYNGNPIRWYTVDTSEEAITLWTPDSVGNRGYDSNEHKNWSGSDICLWLNGEFLSVAFKTPEQNAIAVYGTTEIGEYETIDIDQKIVLPSVDEMGRINDAGIWGINQADRAFGEMWYLRTPAQNSYRVAIVDNGGTIRTYEPYGLGLSNRFGIRPALRLDLSRIVFISDASGIKAKSAAVLGAGLTSISSNSGILKLTVYDENLDFICEDTTNRIVNSGDTVRINYSGAAFGTNIYISCVIEDDDGALFYGKLSDTASGTASFKVPTLDDGDYTIKLFCEEANDDYETDFCGAPVSILMTVENREPAPVYPLAVSAGEGGAVSGTASDSYAEGYPVSVTATAYAGWHFTGWTVYGVILSDYTANPAAFAMPANVATLTANFALDAPAVTNVTISPSTAVVQQNMTQQFAATVSGTNNPATTVTWSVTGNTEAGTGIDVSGLLRVDPDETAGTILTVTATSTVDTTKSGSATVTVKETPPTPVYDISLDVSGTHTFSAATEGYGIATPSSITITNIGNQSTGALTIALSGADASSFTFSKTSITDIAVSGSDSFTVAPITALMPATYTATVIVSGSNGITAAFDVSFTVNAAAVQVSYTITASAGAGGSISPSGSVAVNDGANQTFIITADSNYVISSVYVDGVDQGAINSYTFSGVAGNHTIAVDFAYSGGGGSGGDNGGGNNGGGNNGGGNNGGGNNGGGGSGGDNGGGGSGGDNGNGNNGGGNNGGGNNGGGNNGGGSNGGGSNGGGSNGGGGSGGGGSSRGGGSGGNTATTPTPTPTTTPEPNNEGSGRATGSGGGSTIDTPPGQDPVDNGDGSKSLPGGGTITTPGGSGSNDKTTITVPPGTKIQDDGAITFPSDSGGTITTPGGSGSNDKTTIAVPPGTVIDSNGVIHIPQGSGGGSITDNYGNTFNIPEGAAIFLDDDVPLGYYISIANPFVDIKDSDWFYDAVMFAYSHGLMVGVAPDKFSPNTPITRAMVVTILYRMQGSPNSSLLTPHFTDVDEGKWYSGAVAWAESCGIVEGYGDGKFGPNDPITRQDLAVILTRYADFMGIIVGDAAHSVPRADEGIRPYTGFTDDADIADYAKDAIEQFFKANIIDGYPDGSFKPQDEINRAEAATMIMMFLEAMNNSAATD